MVKEKKLKFHDVDVKQNRFRENCWTMNYLYQLFFQLKLETATKRPSIASFFDLEIMYHSIVEDILLQCLLERNVRRKFFLLVRKLAERRTNNIRMNEIRDISLSQFIAVAQNSYFVIFRKDLFRFIEKI